MGPTLHKIHLPWIEGEAVHALAFIPEATVPLKPCLGLITHGYTSHKGSLLNWSVRLAEEGMASLLFDLPGHYLGGFCEVREFAKFEENAHKLFILAKKELIATLQRERPLDEHIFNESTLLFAGHSLGGQLSLKALALDEFKNDQKKAVVVGLGLPPRGQTHLFSSSFYKSTLHIRGQLVSPALAPDVVFPWIKNEKEKLKLSDQSIHFITGEDDLVVSDQGTERFMEILREQGNTVSLERPTRLPHHQPELAAGHLKKHLKKIGLI